MKNNSAFSFVILLLILTIQTGYSQWQQVLVNNVSYASIAANTGYIFASSNTIIISSDNGSNWFSSGIGGESYSLTSNPTDIFAAAISGYPNFYRTSNNGLAWNTFNLSAADGLLSSASWNSDIFVGTVHYGIRRSTNRGDNWTNLNIGGSFSSMAVYNGRVFAGNETAGIYLSTNNGDNWVTTSFPPLRANCITINGAVVLAGTNNGVYISLNSGLNWSVTSLAGKRINAIVCTGNNIFAGTDSSGVYYSGSNGSNWMQRNEGLTNLKVNALLIKEDYIFNCSGNTGIWRRPLSELIGVQNISGEVPGEYSLQQNYPNPFNPVTNIKFSIPESGFVKLVIYDALGRESAVLFKGRLSAGSYNYDFDASGLASGIYFYTLQSEGFIQTKKMVLVK